MNWNDLLSASLNIGKRMLISGAEIYRVEDCIHRICMAYGAKYVDVIAITSLIVLTIEDPDGRRWTQTRRIYRYDTDLQMVDRLNSLSREICQNTPSYEVFLEKYKQAVAGSSKTVLLGCLFFAVIAGSFTVFVGGGFGEALISMVIGAIQNLVVVLARRLRFNTVLSSILASFAMSALAFLSVGLAMAPSVEHIVTGNVMPLIPGVALTNSIRDMICGDTMSGILRFMEACIVALAIASGFILAGFLLGGLVL